MRTDPLARSVCLALVFVIVPVAAWAQCPPSCPIPGGGAAETDCHAEFASPRSLNFPPYDPADPKPRKALYCFDGDPLCDLDGSVNGECVFDVDVCLRNSDPGLAACTPSDVTRVRVANPTGDPDLSDLQAAINALLPATANVCTDGQTLRVPVKQSAAEGGRRSKPRKVVRIETKTATGKDVDRLTLACVRRGWTNHGYDNSNHRSSPVETTLTPANAANLEVKWTFDLNSRTEGTPLRGITGTPVVGNGTIFTTAANGVVYALAANTGAVKWHFVAGGSMQGSTTLLADGRLLFGNSRAEVYCLNSHTGKLLWTTNVGDQADHIWGAPTVANNRVFVGIASHTDNPCTQGRLVGLDLDTGEQLWELKTVPDKVCDNDTGVTCDTDDECSGGTCIPGIGGGVTATSATDATGDFVYMNTVGCYTFPSIGDSDSMFKVNAATGAVVWKNRVQPPEQFGYCADHRSVECGGNADCEEGETCTEKGAYHDFGFLNGPLVVDADDGAGGRRPLIVSGSKDGTLYAFHPSSGQIAWKREIAKTPVTPGFAGYGLFNGAIAYANDTIYAALFLTIPLIPADLKHLMAFSAVDGHILWDDEIGASWSHVTVANGLLFAGTQSGPDLYIYDAATGQRLHTLSLPAEVVGGATIVDGRIYVPYGLSGTGGIRAFGLP